MTVTQERCVLYKDYLTDANFVSWEIFKIIFTFIICFSEVGIRQLLALKTSDGSYVDFRQFADPDMSAIAALIESQGSEELKASVVVNTEISSQTEVKRLSEAVTLYLQGTYKEADINVVIEQMKLAYEEIGN